jgi:hypothetical protein
MEQHVATKDVLRELHDVQRQDRARQLLRVVLRPPIPNGDGSEIVLRIGHQLAILVVQRLEIIG